MTGMVDGTAASPADGLQRQLTPLSSPWWGVLRTQVEGQQRPSYDQVLIVGWVPSVWDEFAPVIMFAGGTRAQIVPNDYEVRLYVYPTREGAAAARP